MPLLTATGLRKYFGETHAVDDVAFRVEPKELVALIGSNGAGKTTLVNLLSGFVAPDEGTIAFEGANITKFSVHERIRAGVARSFQIVNLFDQLTALDNVRLTIFSRDGKTRSVLRLAESDGEARNEALQILREFGLEEKQATPAMDLAQGERKLLDVAVAYALRPKLILLDEPTSGVGTREKGTIMDIISRVVRELGLAAVIVEHDMDVVFTYSDRIVVMHQGKVLAEGTPEQIRAHERVATILLGHA